MSVLEIGILGPLEVRYDGRVVDLGGARNRALLGVLTLHANEVMSADALAQALRGEEAPATAAKTVQVNVSRLRTALGPAAERVQTVPGGYRLHVEPGELDAERFERAHQAARAAADAAALSAALALWRGPALADLRFEPWAQPEIRRLEELRAAAIEDRVQADLDRGEHARLAGELETLVVAHPLRERLRAQQMLALYRTGRHADALAAYRDARAALDDQGLEPGPELRRLEQLILTHDPGLAPRQPPPAGAPPAPQTPTFGRENDAQAVAAALADARLVTLTGPGGVGKTRLATEVARAAEGRFVPLAAIAHADRIPAAISDTLGIRRAPGEADLDAVSRVLSRDSTLLVLDNLEHLSSAAAVVAELIERTPGLTVLATSRQMLNLRSERVYPVMPLPVGDDPERSPAVALFADRARARAPAFALTADNAGAIMDVCHQLGGLPLAIELAAGRLGLLSPADLASRLADALAVLTRGPQDAPERHRTLRATLDWSFDLLDPPEREAFAAMAAFVGGCDVEAAEAVTGAPLTVIEALADKSLITPDAGRLTLLEPVRQYAAVRLAAAAGAEDVERRHLEFYAGLARRTEEAIHRRSRSSVEYVRIHAEQANFRVAIRRALDRGATLDALALVGDLGAYSWNADPDPDLQELAQRALAAAGKGAPPELRARALFTLLHQSVESGERLEAGGAALELFRALGDDLGSARTLIVISNTHSMRGDYAAGRAAGQESLAHARAAGDEQLMCGALAQIANGTPRIAAAAPLAREAAAGLRRLGVPHLASGVLTTVGMAALREDAYDLATEMQNEALEAARVADDPFSLTFVYGNLGLAALLAGRLDAALAAFRDELASERDNAFEIFRFEGLLGMAALAAAGGHDHRAAALEAAAWAHAAVRPPSASEMPVYARVIERYIDPARERLGAQTWAAAAGAGRAMTPEGAIAFALEDRGQAMQPPALLPD